MVAAALCKGLAALAAGAVLTLSTRAQCVDALAEQCQRVRDCFLRCDADA
jgi:hypothetical protein